jgi:hypothetical protein
MPPCRQCKEPGCQRYRRSRCGGYCKEHGIQHGTFSEVSCAAV